MHILSSIGLLAALLASGCTREQTQDKNQIHVMAEQVIPRVERAVGLPFKEPPGIAVRSRSEVHGYLTRKLDSDFPPDELERVSIAYRLFGFIPDTLDLRSLLLALYTEQVVGYFDPDSSMLYVVEGTDPFQLRVVLAHELVHALQGQYVALDSILSIRHENDRKAAAQAVMEGQATLASLIALMPDQDLSAMGDFWQEYRTTVRAQQLQMPVLASAPLVIREGLIFPYLAGADFARWFASNYRDTVPFGPRLPTSTEQILHPEHYFKGDRPVDLHVIGDDPIYRDNLGEFETRILLTGLSGSESVGATGALGWGGDRYAVFEAKAGFALVWWTVWDTEPIAARFANLIGREWGKLSKTGRRHVVEQMAIDGHAGVRLVDAPLDWAGWKKLPRVQVR